jgi:non-lysosomal glucosylceramidase
MGMQCAGESTSPKGEFVKSTNGSSTAGRRGFLKTVALAAGGASQAEAQAQMPPAGRAATKPVSASTATATAPPVVRYPRTFTGKHLAMIAFPLGGVAAGSIALGGRGQLRDWEIFNRPDKGKSVSYSFPSIWAQVGNAKPVVRVLEAKLMPPYEASGGLSPSQVSGLARLDDATFIGEYPLAKIAFRDRDLPVRVSLEAFTPIIPLDADASGLPAAVLRYIVHNPTKETAKVSIAFSLDNPAGLDLRGGGDRAKILAGRSAAFQSARGMDGLLMTNPEAGKDTPQAGSFALCVLGAGKGEVTHLSGWPRAKWWASPLLFWDDFSDDGRLGPEAPERNKVGSLCLQREIPPGAKAEYTFVMAWHFPNRTPAWCGWASANKEDANTIIGNYYSERFRDAWDAASHIAINLPSLEKRMHQFLAAMRETTIPASIKEAAMANLSTLATQTCFRTADGKFRGFEGIHDGVGCCAGSCTHVWNYETTTQYLFPELARSMREAAFDLAGRLDGLLPIRLNLPEGKQTGGTTAADGAMGQIIKAYGDWQLSGDDAWLRRIWPNVKKTLEFAWVEGGWDADRDGVFEGVQHNTYDVEFYGPNPMCGVYYLAALRAAEEMARATRDSDFAAECRRLFESGSKWIDANLFNGEYYIQKTRGIPREKIAKPLRSAGGAEDSEHPDFQLDQGCLTDQLIGQYLADIAGLGPLLDPANIRKTISSIYKYNHRASLTRHNSVERIYALNDEAAILICDYGKVTRPRIPFPYSSEAWTGIEYLHATQLIYAGMLREGVRTYEDVRRRFDGERRNPWDEPECGHHYARAMSAWSGIVALSGFAYRGPQQSVSAIPRIRSTSFSSFWSTGNAWGVFSQSVQNGHAQFSLSVLYGKLPCRQVELAGQLAAGAKSSASVGKRVLDHKVSSAGQRLRFAFSDAVELREGDRLVLTV